MALFDETTPISEVTAEVLVGEGKKFKTVDDLARGKFESDRVIAARERELQELREELAKRVTMEELIQKVQTTRTPEPNVQAPEPNQPPAAPNSLSEEDLERRIRAIQEKTTQEARQAANAELVTDTLLKTYGTEDKANEVVNAKAKELGVPVKWLQDMATQSPSALFNILGVTGTAHSSVSAPRSTANAAIVAHESAGPKAGTYAAYQEQYRDNIGMKQEYFTPKVQNQIMKDAFAYAEKHGNLEGFFAA